VRRKRAAWHAAAGVRLGAIEGARRAGQRKKKGEERKEEGKKKRKERKRKRI
jgi:hypothetical protein